MIVSPFTPLFFIDRRTDGIESDYIQTFAPTDMILLELIGEPDWNGTAKVLMEPSGETLYQIDFSKWDINPAVRLLFTTISLSPGFYTVEIDGIGRSDVFCVTADKLTLDGTTLIQYSMHNNRQRKDAVFFIDHMQYFFDWRVPGGFKDSLWSFGVDDEQFVTSLGDISQLYSLATTQKKFTLGGNMGVPVWFGEMLNRVLTCSHVYFDGVKYSRKESSVPEISVQIEGVNSFVFSQMLQQSVNLDPELERNNQAKIRRVDNDYYRAVDTNTNRLLI